MINVFKVKIIENVVNVVTLDVDTGFMMSEIIMGTRSNSNQIIVLLNRTSR